MHAWIPVVPFDYMTFILCFTHQTQIDLLFIENKISIKSEFKTNEAFEFEG